MNKTAALAEKLLRMAADAPESAKVLMPKVAALLKQGAPVHATLHEGSVDKLAGPDTAAFAAWAIARGKTYSVQDCATMLDRLKVPMIELEDRVVPKRGPLKEGETVSPNAHMNVNEANVDACRKYHKEHGEVEKVDSDGVAVRFDDGRLIRFEGENKPGKFLGIGRSTRPSVVSQRSHGRAAIELVYISDKNAKPPGKARIQEVQDYVDKGELKGEKRNRSYYSGLALKQAMGKAGYYFTLFTQGRDKFLRSINPKKGTVLYIGRLGGRPGGWRAEYEAQMAAATPEPAPAPAVEKPDTRTDEEVFDNLDFGKSLM